MAKPADGGHTIQARPDCERAEQVPVQVPLLFPVWGLAIDRKVGLLSHPCRVHHGPS
jgi:hypothetical protein